MRYHTDEQGVRIFEPDHAKEYLELILDIAYDYDGQNTINGLKELIKEMKQYASKALECIKNGDI